MRGIYIVGRYPDREKFIENCKAIDDAGYEFIEIGLPFSEPVADGPVIAGAIQEAIESGADVYGIYEDIKEMNLKCKVYIMTYANIVHGYGLKKFSEDFGKYIEGIIIPDVPNRMHEYMYEEGFSIPLIPFVTPESRLDDIKDAGNMKGDFIYFIGIRGITGGDVDLNNDELSERVGQLKELTGKPVVMGFGIKERKAADEALKLADGFVVGTAAVSLQKDTAKYKEFIDSLIK